jgi:hypothetical protein
MGLVDALLGSVALAGGAAALYGLHRLCLWLEERGHLYYKYKKPSGGGGWAGALQEFYQPQVHHVLQVKGEKRHHAENEAPGETDAQVPEDAAGQAPDDREPG